MSKQSNSSATSAPTATSDRHQQKAYPLRLPDTLKAQLQHQAIDNRRSLNNEIVVRLEDSIRRQDEAKTKEPA